MRGSEGCRREADCEEVGCRGEVLLDEVRLSGRKGDAKRALDRIRTCDLGLRRSLLCPLSYEGVSSGYRLQPAGLYLLFVASQLMVTGSTDR